MDWAIIGMVITGAMMLLLRDWRLYFPALLVNYICIAGFLNGQRFIAPDVQVLGLQLSTTVVIKLITGLAATAILTITALAFSREYNPESLDEFSLTELRRAARRAQVQALAERRRVADYLVPAGALLLALLASNVLPRIYPIGQSYAVDFVWYWLGLVGLFALVTATDLLKIGIGLLLCVSSIELLYTAVARTVQIFSLGFLSLLTIVLALAIAYLSALVYARLKTLELVELYRA